MRRQVVVVIVALGAALSGPAPASGQDAAEPLRLAGLLPVGARSSVTEAWGTLQFTVENRGDTPRQARVVAFYPEGRDLQFARDVWVPAHSRVTSWLSVGPAPEQRAPLARHIHYQLFDRTGGANREVDPRDPDRVPSRPLPYHRREPTTAVYADAAADEHEPDPFDDRNSPAAEAVRLAQTFRDACWLSEPVSIIRTRYLPAVPEAFDGIDQFVLASNRLAADPVGRQALRQWVLHGGTLWVLLDRVDPEVVAPVLGEDLRFQVVGRTSLPALRLRGAKEDRARAERRAFDQPVELVRVLLSGSETLLADANDWPAAFSQPLGRGRVVFTTLGARGWYRPRAAGDPRSRYEHAPDLPIAVEVFKGVTSSLYTEQKDEVFDTGELAPLLAAEIGYEVVGRRTAGAILAAFLVGLVAVAVGLRRSRWPEVIGLGAPAVALAAAAAFLVAGGSARRGVPPTAAAAAVVTVSPDGGDEHWEGLFAVYNPTSGGVEVSAPRGGLVDFDQAGLEGSSRRRVETDLAAWHWEGLAFPAGVRMGPFRATGRSGVSAVARFGPRGLEGRLAAGGFRDPADAVIRTRLGATLAVRLEADGSFRVNSDDLLPAGQYIAGAVLTDRQQRRQEAYRRFFAQTKPPADDHERLYVWAEAGELPFAVAGATRTVGQVLLAIPIGYEYAGGESVLIPDGFVPFVAVLEDRSYPPRLEHTEPVRSRLRFQLPTGGRPFVVERATLLARVHAPSRKFSVLGVADGQTVPQFEQLGPDGPVRVEVTDPRLLRTDSRGGLLLEVAVGERIGPDGREQPFSVREQGLKWQIESLGLEVVGRFAKE
jgi:hypothetical protein